MGSLNGGWLGRGGAYEFVVVSNCACSVIGTTKKREPRPRDYALEAWGQLSARLPAAEQGARALWGTPGNRQRDKVISLNSPFEYRSLLFLWETESHVAQASHEQFM